MLLYSEFDFQYFFSDIYICILSNKLTLSGWQALAVVTLGDKQMAQRIDSLDGVDEFKRFYLQVSLEIDYFNVLLYLCGCYLFSEIWAMFEKPNWTGWLDLEPIVCLV